MTGSVVTSTLDYQDFLPFSTLHLMDMDDLNTPSRPTQGEPYSPDSQRRVYHRVQEIYRPGSEQGSPYSPDVQGSVDHRGQEVYRPVSHGASSWGAASPDAAMTPTFSLYESPGLPTASPRPTPTPGGAHGKPRDDEHPPVTTAATATPAVTTQQTEFSFQELFFSTAGFDSEELDLHLTAYTTDPVSPQYSLGPSDSTQYTGITTSGTTSLQYTGALTSSYTGALPPTATQFPLDLPPNTQNVVQTTLPPQLSELSPMSSGLPTVPTTSPDRYREIAIPTVQISGVMAPSTNNPRSLLPPTSEYCSTMPSVSHYSSMSGGQQIPSSGSWSSGGQWSAPPIPKTTMTNTMRVPKDVYPTYVLQSTTVPSSWMPQPPPLDTRLSPPVLDPPHPPHISPRLSPSSLEVSGLLPHNVPSVVPGRRRSVSRSPLSPSSLSPPVSVPIPSPSVDIQQTHHLPRSPLARSPLARLSPGRTSSPSSPLGPPSPRRRRRRQDSGTSSVGSRGVSEGVLNVSGVGMHGRHLVVSSPTTSVGASNYRAIQSLGSVESVGTVGTSGSDQVSLETPHCSPAHRTSPTTVQGPHQVIHKDAHDEGHDEERNKSSQICVPP
ncbi:unnamed protein product, partial [Meganyctiphanes norvegica]